MKKQPAKRRFLVKVPIGYPTDPKIVARLVAGENLPFEQRGHIRECKVGEIVDDIPEVSISHELALRRIEEVVDG